MIRRILAAVITLALAALLLVACWPQLLGLERVFAVAQLVSLRGLAALLAVLVGVLLTVLALLSRPGRRFLAGLAVLLLAFAAVSTAVLAVRGFGDGALPTKAPADLVVLGWNTLGDAPGPQAIAELALSLDADVVALPETSPDAAGAVATIMAEAGHPVQQLGVQFDQISKARSTMLLISQELGEYAIDDTVGNTRTLPSVVAVPVDGSGPTIIAAHPVAPVPGEMAGWRASLDWLADRCSDPGSDVIAAGDFNSTLDHWASFGSDAGLAACRDAARATGNAAVGTWPTRMPPLLGTPIDHVIATDAWQVVGFRVIESVDGGGSDHRPVVAQLRPADG